MNISTGLWQLRPKGPNTGSFGYNTPQFDAEITQKTRTAKNQT